MGFFYQLEYYGRGSIIVVINPLMIKTTHISSPRQPKPEPILSERQLLNTIDQCPQIPKQDKLYLRNKIKQIYKDHQLGDPHLPDHSFQLLNIFSTCTKPLNKVHLYENHWHWLQVKLRKYIVNQKKKYKEECLNLFKKEKGEEKRGRKMIERKIREECFSRGSRCGVSVHGSEYKGSSQENRRPQSPVFNQNRKLVHTSRNRNLSGSVTPSYEIFTNFFGPQTCKNSQSHNENRDWNQFPKPKPKQNKSSTKVQAVPQSKQRQKVRERSKFRLADPKRNDSVVINQQCDNEVYPQILEFSNEQTGRWARENQLGRLLGHDINLDGYELYEGKSGDSHEVFTAINIKEDKKSGRNAAILEKIYDSHQTSDIFTSPQLLEQCRKFIKKSDNSEYNSPQFAKPTPPAIQKFATPKEMLRYIFRKDWTVFISASERQELIQRCPVGSEQIVSQLLSESEFKTSFISFIDICPAIRRCLDINFAFSNIFLLLDVDSKGIVTPSDYETFLENFTDCPIEAQTISDLRHKLKKFQMVTQQVFRDHDIVPGCFEYLELLERREIFQLGEILQMFQFEIDSRQNTEGNELE